MSEASEPRSRRNRSLLLRGCLVVVLGTVIGGAAAAAVVRGQVRRFLETPPRVEGEEVIVEIPRGASGMQVAEILADRGVVTDSRRFYWLLRARDAVPDIRAGEFAFRTDWTPEQVVDALRNAPEVTYPLTVPEGLRYTEIAVLVEEAGRGWSGDRFLELCRDPALVERMADGADDLEGYLFPETYRFSRHATEDDVVEAMLSQFEAHFGEAWQARAEELGMTRHQVVILASLIEKETAVPDERPLVSSVFHNRLRIGMKLECDPTIIYGLKDYRGTIYKSDIRDPHPWNTYVHAGLPRGPIANPGAGALDAALHPADSRYLYFVAKDDGTHHFSTSYAEHARMVRRYQRAH